MGLIGISQMILTPIFFNTGKSSAKALKLPSLEYCLMFASYNTALEIISAFMGSKLSSIGALGSGKRAVSFFLQEKAKRLNIRISFNFIFSILCFFGSNGFRRQSARWVFPLGYSSLHKTN